MNRLIAMALALFIGQCLVTPTNLPAAKITLHWTAPGDDSMSGTAAGYDLRCSQVPIDVNNWSNARQIVTPAPKQGGTNEQLSVSCPTVTIDCLKPRELYYFRIVAFDSVGNYSELSNQAAVLVPDFPWPNPFKISAGTITFPTLENTTLIITTLRGDIVRKWTQIGSAVTWDGRNQYGIQCGPGAYNWFSPETKQQGVLFFTR